jgi:hypothetical protein
MCNVLRHLFRGEGAQIWEEIYCEFMVFVRVYDLTMLGRLAAIFGLSPASVLPFVLKYSAHERSGEEECF